MLIHTPEGAVQGVGAVLHLTDSRSLLRGGVGDVLEVPLTADGRQRFALQAEGLVPEEIWA
jgi:hypothetical protein